jgi:hypothetical protein
LTVLLSAVNVASCFFLRAELAAFSERAKHLDEAINRDIEVPVHGARDLQNLVVLG